MPFTIDQLEFLGVRVGIAIPPAFIENKRREVEFKTRQEKATTDVGGKASDWGHRAKFDGLLRGAADNAGKKKYDLAIKLIDEAEALLAQPDPPPPPPEPTAEEQEAAEVSAEDFAALFEQDPAVLLKREWEQKKDALLPTLKSASEMETPVKTALTRIVLELDGLEKAGKFKEALAQLEKARAPLKTALEAKPDPGGSDNAARLEFIVARNKAINDLTDAKASKGFGKPYTTAVKAIAGLEKPVQDCEAAQKWPEGLTAIGKLHEHARSVLEMSARTLKAQAEFTALDKTMNPKFKQMLALRGQKGKAIEEKIAAALLVGNAIGAAGKVDDFEEMLKQLQILAPKVDEVLAAGKQYDLDKVAYNKRWNEKIVPKAAAASKLTPPPVTITKLREDQDAHNALIQAKVKDGDFPGASGMLDKLIELSQAVLDARTAWEKEKKDFETALAKAKDQLAQAQSTGAVISSVGALRDTYASELKKMDDFVKANDFAAALPQLKDKVLPSIKPFLDARADYDQAKQAYAGKKAALADKLAEAAGFTPATPELVSLKEAHDKELKALTPLESARDFTAATALLQGAVTTTLNTLLAEKKKHDKAKSDEVETRKDAAAKGAKAMLGDMKNIVMVDPSKAAERVEGAIKKSKDLSADADLKNLLAEGTRVVGMNDDALKALAQGELMMLEALENSLTQAINHCDTYQQAHKSTSKSKTDQDKFRQAEALRSSHEVLRLRIKTIRASFASIEAKATQPDDLAKAEAAHLYGLLAKTGSTPEIKAGAAARQRAIMTTLLKDAKSPDRVREIAEIIGEPALSLYKAQDAKPSVKDLRSGGTAAADQKKAKLQNPERAANVELASKLSDRLITDEGLDVMALHLQNLDELDDGTPAGKAMARTLKQLRDDPKLQALFDGLPAPKRDNPICDMLRATLGKKGDAELTPAEVKKAVLSAMLAELRQMDVGSCFGTSVAVHVHDSQPGMMLKDMTEMLSTGAITRLADGKIVEAPVQPRMSDAQMQTKLKLGKDGKLKSTNGEDLGAAQPLESTPAFSSALDSLGVAGPKRKAALQTAQQDLQNQNALKAAMAKLPATIDDAAREKLRLAVLDRLAASPKASVKVELAKEVQKLKPQPPASDRKEIAKSAQDVLDAPEQEATSGELLRQIAMRENGISDADLARLDKMKELRPKVMALQGNTTSPEALKLLDEYDELQKKIGAKAPQVAQFMKDLTAAQDGYLSKEDNRLLRCWEYTVSALAEQGISRKNTAQLNGATTAAVTDELNAALGELDTDDKFKKASKKLDVPAMATALRDRCDELMPQILQTGYDASVEAELSSDGSSSRGAFYLFDTQGIKDPKRWIKIDDQSKYVTVVRGIVMLAWQELFEREKDKNKKEVSRTIADKLADRLSKESFVNAAKDKVKASTGEENQLPWQMISGSHQNFMSATYFGKDDLTKSATKPNNPDELAEFVVGTTSDMWDKVKDGVATNPDGTSVPMGNGPHAFNLKPGGEKLQKLAAQPGKTGTEKVAAFKSAEQADNRARLDAAASPQVVAKLKKKFMAKYHASWEPVVQAELDKLANPTVKQVSDAIEKAMTDTYISNVLPGKLNEAQQKALAEGQPFDQAATRQQLIDNWKSGVLDGLAPAIKETTVPPVKKADQEKLLDKVIRKTGIDEDLVDAVRARALKTLGDNASTSDVEAAVRKAMEAEGVTADGAMSQTILDGISQAHGPDGLVFADSNWGSGAHRTMFSMVVNPLSGEMEMWQMNEDGSGMKKMDQKTWVECGWDIKTEPKEFSAK